MYHINFTTSILISLIYNHFAIIIYEIYYHRGIIHNRLVFLPAVSFIFEFFSWLLFDKVPNKYLLCSHKIHHAYSDRLDGFDGPITKGIKYQLLDMPISKIISQLTNTFNLFRKNEVYPPNEIQKKFLGDLILYKNNFEEYSGWGNFVFLLINILFFGTYGVLIYFLFVIFLNVTKHVIVDGICHLFGYTNYPSNDNSKNIFPIGFFLCGAELHHNHHKNPNSAKLSQKWFEFDIGWSYIKILRFLKLCKIN